MSKNTAKQNEITHRRRRVAKYRIERGWTQREIASYLNVSVATINADIKALDKQWLEHAKLDTDALRAQQLAEINRVKDWAWLKGPEELRTILQALALEAKITGTIAPPSFSFNFNLSIMQQIAKAAEDSGMSASETYEALMNTFAEQKRRKGLGDAAPEDQHRPAGQEYAHGHDDDRR